MLEITVPACEMWDERNQEFIYTTAQTLQLEHSLVSLSKWESKWCKPFLTKKEKTYDETIDYIKCMTLTKNVKPEVYLCLSKENIDAINRYIEAPMTATTFSDTKTGRTGGGTGELITAELVYYWMVALQIPFECQKWHLNKLLTLVKVCNIKNQPPKKMGRRALLNRNHALNEARRQQFNTNG